MKTASPLRRGARESLAALGHVLEAAYGTPEADLGNMEDPLDEAIYIILSFQTDLPRSRARWFALRSAYPTWESLERAPVREVAEVLREGGLHRQKARTILRLLTEVRRAAGTLSLNLLRSASDDVAERFLTRLPGLSWKGARCVLLYSLGRRLLPVDGNTFRILKRTGILHSRAVYRRRSLHDALQSAVPAARRRALHVNLVVHGQRTCLPAAPQCPRCPVRSVCRMEGVPAKIRRLARPLGPPHPENTRRAVTSPGQSASGLGAKTAFAGPPVWLLPE
jgi:endonuclease III